ncbi:MAG: vitamin B12-dependent ribonucleotide reductase, partial [Phycisphaerales bacterium]|nr:vitamin B12-dependent ribonucleotide reductase [Phycisphaerales bacterium]
KFKKLAGGGYFKIANNSVRPALRALGYRPDQIDEMMISLLGALDLDVPMPAGDNAADTGFQEGMTFAQWLRGRGASEDDLAAIKGQLQGVFELKSAFSAWGLSDDTLGRLGIDAVKARADKQFNGLRAMGLSATQAEALNRLVCGTQTIESAPHLRDEHLPVFDCASKCGKVGTRFIAAEGHIRMMAAAQPFITGAISKTINLPHDATVEDIQSCYRLSWELGLKANALYRDGCKLSQPLNATADTELEAEDPDELDEALEEVADDVMAIAAAAAVGDAVGTVEIKERIVHRPMRRRLSDTRSSVTHKFNVAGHEGYLTVGLYDDRMPGELFITMAKEGSTIGGLMDSLGTATSVALQYGVPLNSLVRKFTHQRFEPAGMTTNKDIP